MVEDKTVLVVDVIPGKFRPYYLASKGNGFKVTIFRKVSNESADKVPISADKSADKVPISADIVPVNEKVQYTEQQWEVLGYVEKNGSITTKEAESILQVKQRRARTILCKLVDNGALNRIGAYKNSIYIMGKPNHENN
jgi:predicted HTH transcriptional regulator